MTDTLSSHPTARAWSSRIPAGVLTAGRFVIHFAEMWIAMIFGMMMYMAIPGVMALPAFLHQVGMAVSMALPMVAWMRIRGHGWRHGIEMAIAMLVPWAAVLGLVALGAASALPWLAQSGTAAMALGMLGIMLVRREHYAGGAHHDHAVAHGEPQPRRHIPWRRIFLVTAYIGAILLVPSTVGIANAYNKTFRATEPFEAPMYTGALPAPPTPDPTKKIAVVIAGPHGGEIGDTLETYEVLARSGIWNVYSVAPERTELPLIPGYSPTGSPSSLDFVPHFSFAEYDAQVGRAPDLIAVPFINVSPDSATDAPVFDWIRGHFGPNTTLLGICSGTMALADTGLLAGRTATSNSGTFDYVASHSPTTTWLQNLRYVDDGNIITSTNLTGGIDAALHTVDRFGGRAMALEVARQIGYTQTGALDDPRFSPPSDLNSIAKLTLNAAFEGPKQQLGVLVYDGVTELGLSGIIDPVVAAESARTFVMAPHHSIVRSHGGFQFLPRYDFGTVPSLDRVVVPAGENATAKQQAIAAWSTFQPRQSVDDIYQKVGSGETAYDATLVDLARTHSGALARLTSEGLSYSAAPQDFSNASWPVSEVLAYLALSLLGAALVFAATHVRFPGRSQDAQSVLRASAAPY